jgi:hypothetical protein
MAPQMFSLITAASMAAAIEVPSTAVAYQFFEWSQRGNYRVATDQSISECTAIAKDRVTVVPHGFLIDASNEFVPQEESRPSPDGGYWHCSRSDQRPFFLVPLEQY